MKKGNLFQVSTLLAFAAVLSIESLSAMGPPPPPPPPGAPGAPSGTAPSESVNRTALGQMLRWAQRNKLIEIKEGVSMDDLLTDMIKQKVTVKPEADTSKSTIKKPTLSAKPDAAMQVELAERLKKRSLSSSTGSLPDTKETLSKKEAPEEQIPMRNLRKSGPGRLETIPDTQTPTEAPNPFGVQLKKRSAPAEANRPSDTQTSQMASDESSPQPPFKMRRQAPSATAQNPSDAQPNTSEKPAETPNPWGIKLRKTAPPPA